MCLYPKLIDNPKYKSTKKNGGNIPPITDQRVKKVPIGCGNCIECRKRKSREWQTRLLEDIRHNKNAYFITLTFSEEKLAEIQNKIQNNITGYERDNAKNTRNRHQITNLAKSNRQANNGIHQIKQTTCVYIQN